MRAPSSQRARSNSAIFAWFRIDAQEFMAIIVVYYEGRLLCWRQRAWNRFIACKYQTVSFCMTSSRPRPVHANVPVFSFNVVYKHPSMPTKGVSRRLIRIAVVVENDVVHVALCSCKMTSGWCCSQQQLYPSQIWLYTHIIHTIEHKYIIFGKNPARFDNIACAPLSAMYKYGIYLHSEFYLKPAKTCYTPNELHSALPVYSMSRKYQQAS
jgi:hypothetical protein